jgi:hypothetical protein
MFYKGLRMGNKLTNQGKDFFSMSSCSLKNWIDRNYVEATSQAAIAAAETAQFKVGSAVFEIRSVKAHWYYSCNIYRDDDGFKWYLEISA